MSLILQGGDVLVTAERKRGLFSSLARSLSSPHERSLPSRAELVTRATNSSEDASTAAEGTSVSLLQSYVLGSGTTLLYRPAATGGAANALPLARSDEPAIYCEGELACAFFGQLESEALHDLVARYGVGSAMPGSPRGSPRNKRGSSGSSAWASTSVANTASPASVLPALLPELHNEPRQLAAALVALLYAREGRCTGDPTVLLSELQGQFSFVLADGSSRHILAARAARADSTPLFIEVSDEGVSVASAPLEIPGAEWSELLPGHLLSGRQVQQFALTPAQLSWRSSYEYSLEEESLGSPRVASNGADINRQWDEEGSELLL